MSPQVNISEIDLYLLATITKSSAEVDLERVVGAAIRLGPAEASVAHNEPISHTFASCPNGLHFHAEENLFSGWVGHVMETKELAFPDWIAITEPPCFTCAKLISNWPIKKVIAPKPSFSKWFESQDQGRKYLEAAGIEIIDPLDLKMSDLNEDWPEKERALLLQD